MPKKPSETKPMEKEPKDHLSKAAKDVTAQVGDFDDKKPHLTEISKHFYGIFQQNHLASALLTAVAQGNQDKAERMPKPSILLHKADVIDYSGRHFKQITAYQYALWAGDRNMVRMIEDKVRHVQGEEGKILRDALSAQRTELEKNKLNYTLNGNLISESHYNPQFLFTAYEKLINLNEELNNRQRSPEDMFLLRDCLGELGAQQKLMPAHMIQEMCAPHRGFKPKPKFEEDMLVRTFAGYTLRGEDNTIIQVFPPEAKEPPLTKTLPTSDEEMLIFFDVGFLIVRSDANVPVAGLIAVHPLIEGGAKDDLEALKDLYKIRVAELAKVPDFLQPDAESKQSNNP